MTRSLYLTMSAAPAPGAPVPDLVRLLQERGWSLTVLSTPTGARFHDLDHVASLTGEPARVEFRRPGTGRSLPPPDVLLACPWSFNSTNKAALGLADNFAVALVCEMLGRGVTTVIVPKTGAALAAHPAFERSLSTLASIPGATILYDADRPFPSWETIADQVEVAAG
ncbi:flavoprotein [Nocardiopsis sp. JB363]|uniref:flavoprotein n=1 Tax=Nocardiopsis sp. JB363 TaxID=1434837 RepID=UPI00097B1706|nr:flavoprotein [Nocardiopsis sp. JB363]SIO87431.1 Phosphopantothenoylcysteine decarboxylase homolog [Nocardiopsis sp. JB363]